MKRIVLFLPLLIGAHFLYAQSSDLRGIIYNHELSGGATIHTAGWSIFMDVGRRDEFKKKTLWEFEISQLHNPKEVKQTIDFGLAFFGFSSPKPFVYAKQNNFYLVNVSYGKQFMIAERAEKSGVEVGLKVLGGLSLGLLKPYYLNVLYPTDNSNNYTIKTIRYSDETADKFLDWFSIYGGAGFIYGFDHIRVIPGIHLKSGLNFDWAQSEDAIKGLEVGVTFDAYYKKVPIMIIDNNAQFYPNLYISLQFGKKW
jgi:hypothetical protein